MADKKKLGDYIEVLLPAFGNQIATIYRDETKSDEQWQQAKAAAKESGTLRTLKEGETKTSGQRWTRDDGDTLELRDPMTGVVAKMPRGDISEKRWQALKKQVAAGETKLDWQQNKEWDAPEPEPAPVQVKGVKQRIIGPNGQEGPTTVDGVPVVEAPTAVPGAGGFFQKAMTDAATGALPGPPGMGTPPGPIPEGQGSLLDSGEVDLTGIPEGAGKSPIQAIGDFAAEVPQRVKEFGQFMSDRPTQPEPGRPVAVDGTRLGDPLDQKAPNAPAPAPVDPNATGAKLGVQTTTTTPGSGGGSLEGDLNRAYADQLRAKKEIAGQEAQQYAENAQLEVQKAKSLQIAEQARAAKAQAQLEAQDQLIAAQMKVAESLGEQLKVDPKRLWASRTAEQKSNARLAGFLFGLAGSGADYVRSLQQEVQNDIQTQIQQFEANRASKVAQFNAMGSAFALYRQQGLDAAASAKAAEASILDVHATKLKEIEMRYKGTTAGARAAEAGAALGVERVAAVNKARDSAAQQANLLEARKLQKLDIEAKMLARLGLGVNGKPMPSVLAQDVNRLKDELAKVRQMKESVGGFGQRLKTQIGGRSLVQVGPLADWASNQSTYALRRAELLKGIMGALSKDEYERAKDILPEKITALQDMDPYFNNLEAFVQESINRRLDPNAAGSYMRAGGDGGNDRGESAGGQGGAR